MVVRKKYFKFVVIMQHVAQNTLFDTNLIFDTKLYAKTILSDKYNKFVMISFRNDNLLLATCC